MNRQIKFRAWDKKGRKWLRDFSIHETGAFLHLINSIEECPDVAVMQFTGLLDKNGKEIYEGDVMEITEIATQEKHLSGPVSWLPAIAGWWLEGTSLGYLWRKDDYFELRVVGNIYENPELLRV